ncbi:MAG: ribonuclease R [Lachnospiraceae bacterium]|nr:ribonuclease R [Lachnospiraceae bacterium]
MSEGLEKRKKVLLDLMKDEFYVPMKQKELAIVLDLPKERREELIEALDALLAERKITCSKRGKYSITKEVKLTGTYCGHPNGFGFVQFAEDEEDIFIPVGDSMGAMHGDTVEVVLTASPVGKRQEGKVTAIVEHAHREIIGFFEQNKSFGFVRPDNQKLNEDIFIPKNYCAGARQGDKVVVKITSYGDKKHKPEGKITEILGNVKDPGVDILSIAKGYGMVEEFPPEVLAELADVADEVPEESKRGRRDLRNVQMVTIDGEDAKDLDDAVNVTYDGQFYYLGVHIADVSHYVREKTALNAEGYNRATSVYLVDRVIPMLPRKLSNGLCSLNEGVDRLALSCLMTIDEKGVIVDHEICESVINVDRRMSYTQVRAIIEDHEEVYCREFEELVPMFELMAKLSHLLRENRRKRGSIDFDFPETKVILNEKGKAVDIKPYDRNTATKLIEDFMLAANETVAQDYYWQEIPFLYRTHEKPDPEKMQKLSIFIHNFGLTIKGTNNGEVHPKEIQKLLAGIDGRPEEPLVSRLALRSMKQAKYTAENTGHFGLAAPFYCHFTSPIRRYPDLQIHRIIKENLHGTLTEKRREHYDGMMAEVGLHCSQRERRAEEAERETVKLKKIEYMQDKWDEVFEGVISGVTNWGFYVELPNTVEGLVRMSDLNDDYYEFYEDSYELIGKAKNKHYKLGQSVRVRLNNIDKLMRTIDFVLAEDEEENE